MIESEVFGTAKINFIAIFLQNIIFFFCRWAKQGQLPFFQVTRHMPGYMKFGLGDFACLCPRK